jgi:cytochrome c oxidase subunit 2
VPYSPQASGFAEGVDKVFLFIFVLSVVVLILVTSLIVYFVFRYSRKRNPEPVDIEGNLALETAWTLIPLVLFLAMFYFGWTEFWKMRNPPRDAMVVEVTARQWAWSFEYPDGRRSDELYVALDRPVKLELRSQDVLHGFAVSEFRVKADVVPGKVNYLWFTPKLLGTYDIQCTVLCGTHHSYMLSKVHVLPEDDFKAWYFREDEGSAAGTVASDAPAPSVDATCETLLEAKDCLMCHTLDGSEGLGPSLSGLMGSRLQVVVGDERRELTVDEAYLRDAILRPEVHVRVGYSPEMPETELEEGELEQLVECMKSLQ